MAWAVVEFGKEGMTLLGACEEVSKWLQGSRGFKERGRYQEAPSAIAIRSRFKRLRTAPRGRKALKETSDLYLSPEIQAVPPGRPRAYAILVKLWEDTFTAPEVPWLDRFKAPPMRVGRINTPEGYVALEEP